MTFSELILKRESCRSYSDKPVEREKLLACIEAARLAPSACNSQPWRFILVDDQDKKAGIAEYVLEKLSGMNKFAAQASAFVVVLEGKVKLSAKLGGAINDQHYANLDVGGAIGYLTLAATEQGLGTCILGWFDEKKIQKLLGIPAATRIRAVVAFGYPQSDTPRNKMRKRTEDILSINTYNNKE